MTTVIRKRHVRRHDLSFFFSRRSCRRFPNEYCRRDRPPVKRVPKTIERQRSQKSQRYEKNCRPGKKCQIRIENVYSKSIFTRRFRPTDHARYPKYELRRKIYDFLTFHQLSLVACRQQWTP